MKISYKWLQKIINLQQSPEEIAEKLTACSFEVEQIIKQGEGLESVVVGEVMEKIKHPDADKLSVVQVRVAEDKILQIVCGAANIAVGQKVAAALVGAVLPGGLEIQERALRGQQSCGMVCSANELGLIGDSEGILVLDSNLTVGTNVATALGLDDVVFDIDILPNRAHDCLCHYGVARELAVLFGLNIEEFLVTSPKEVKSCVEGLQVEVQNFDKCRRYSARLVQNVCIQESPKELQQLLVSCGLRSINNVVDITNYIMFTYGQPLHSFDADKVCGDIVVRVANVGEEIIALDDKKYILDKNDLVICDSEKILAIAGVIGGKESAVTSTTKNIILESANFEGTGIRKTARKLKISTDSAYRFEREIDYNMTLGCLEQASGMVRDLTSGAVFSDIVDVYQQITTPKVITFSLSRIDNFLGIHIVPKVAEKILTALGFSVVLTDEIMIVTVPSHRLDIEKVNDILEEIARIYGYDQIPTENMQIPMSSVKQSREWHFKRQARSILMGMGFVETYNYSFIGHNDIDKLQFCDQCVELKNYLSEEAKYFRPSLVSGFLKNIQENGKYFDDFRMFELGSVAYKIANGVMTERVSLGGLMYVKDITELDFLHLKGCLESMFQLLGVRGVEFSVGDIMRIGNFWYNGRVAEIQTQDKYLGVMGEVSPQVLEKYDITGKVLVFELEAQAICSVMESKAYQPINRMPLSEFDISAVFDIVLQWKDIKDTVLSINSPFIISVVPFDVYQGEALGENSKSLAFRVTLQSREKTLSDADIQQIRQQVIQQIELLGGQIRK